MTVQSNEGLWNSGTYLPFRCDVTNVTQGQSTVVTTSVNHGFVVGNSVTFIIPKQWGIIQLNGMKGFVTSITANTLTVNIDSTFFDAFVTPTVTSPTVIDNAQVLCVGDANSGTLSPGSVFAKPNTVPGAYYNTFP